MCDMQAMHDRGVLAAITGEEALWSLIDIAMEILIRKEFYRLVIHTKQFVFESSQTEA